MKKRINVLLLLITTAVMTSCFVDGGVPTNQPRCTWENNGIITFDKVQLHHPETQVWNFNIMYPWNPIDGLDAIFRSGEEMNPIIEVTVKGNNCRGEKSKPTEYKKKDDLYVTNNELLYVNNIYNAKDVEVTVEITSKPHTDMHGEPGIVIWSKKLTADPFNSIQDGEFKGTFKSTSGTKKVWVGRSRKG